MQITDPKDVHSALGEIQGMCMVLKGWVSRSKVDAETIELIETIYNTAETASKLATSEVRDIRAAADKRYDKLIAKMLRG